MTVREQMSKQGRDESFCEQVLNDPENDQKKWDRIQKGASWYNKRVSEKVKWEQAPEEERSVIPEWGGREVGAFSIVGAIAATADQFLNPFGPPGADAANVNAPSIYRQPKGLLTPWVEYTGADPIIAQIILSIIIVLLTGVMWHFIFKAANQCDAFIRSKITAIDEWWSKDREPKPLPTPKTQPKQRPNKLVHKATRDVGVQSQCHYSWHAHA